MSDSRAADGTDSGTVRHRIAAAIRGLDLVAEFQERGDCYVDLDRDGNIVRWSPPDYSGEIIGHIAAD